MEPNAVDEITEGERALLETYDRLRAILAEHGDELPPFAQRNAISVPSRSIASPRCAATRTSSRLCSTVSPPSTAWAKTRSAAATVPRRRKAAP